MATTYFPVSWNTYHTLAQSLAEKILADNKKFDQIVAISRGGLTLGHLLSDLLQTQIATIAIQSYTDIQTQGELKIMGKLPIPIRGQRVLLVDDVADTGKTLKRAISYLKKSHPTSVTTATMFYKPHSVFKPDYFVKTTSQWIIYPHDTVETIRQISKSLLKEGKSDSQIADFLMSLKFTKDQIQFTRKHYPS